MSTQPEQPTTPQFDPELDDARSQQIEAGLREDGIDPWENAQVDYFDMGDNERVELPDGISWVEIKPLTEGDRKKYLKAVNRDLKILRGTGDALMKLAAGEERTALLREAVVDWNLIKGGSPFPFNPGNLRVFLDSNPTILEMIEKKVREMNPWLMQNMTVADIDEQIEELQRMRAEVEAREAGEDDSGS